MLALHVHHGLSPNADVWEAQGAARCRQWARAGKPVEFASRRLAARPAAGDSIEAWARRARYRALREMVVEHGVDLVLLAHHRRDQAETFMLQALRGGGVAALSAMPALTRREGVTWARPWLEMPREAIEAYARAHRLRWAEDESNGDDRFARNRLRRQVWPALVGGFVDAEVSLANAARWAQQAAALSDEIAALDLASIADAQGLDLATWRALSTARQSAALRRWLPDVLAAPVPATLVERVLREADPGGTKQWPVGSGRLIAYRGRLNVRTSRVDPIVGAPTVVDLSRPGLYPIAGWGGAFAVERVGQGGLAVAQAASLSLRERRAGDRFQAGPGRPPRSLKLQYQAAGLSALQRFGPIACSGEAVVFVPGLGLDARAVTKPGVPQVALAWLPARAATDETPNDAG